MNADESPCDIHYIRRCTICTTELALTHFDLDRDPFGHNFACEQEPKGRWGVTSETEFVTCPDCLLRIENLK